MFCTSATFSATALPCPSPPCHFLCTSHNPSLAFLPRLPLPPQFPICFPDGDVSIQNFGTFAALTRGLNLSAFHCSVCPFGCTFGIAIFCIFVRAQKHSNLALFTFHCMSRASSENLSQARTDNIINLVPMLYLLDLDTFRVALLFPYPQRFWHHVIVSLSKCWDGSPWPRPTATPDVYPCPTLGNVGNWDCWAVAHGRSG
jgi:hypothetical protein